MSAERLRILLTHVYGWPEVQRGAERYVHELAAALAWLGHDVRVLISSPRPGRTTVLGVPVIMLRRPGEMPATQRRQAQFGARTLAHGLPRRIDVWHANSMYDAAAAVLAATLRPSLRTVFTAHGPVEKPTIERQPRRGAFALARRADEVVCVSEPAAGRLREDFLMSPRVVPPGVDAAAFSPGGRRSEHPVVLYVGALASRRKNLALLLDAIEVAGRSEPALEVWLVGQGDPGPTLASAAPDVRSRVRLLGPLQGDALVAAYRSAWVTALVSEREVFGMVVVESLACGTPALVLDDCWGPAQIVSDGVGVRAAATAEALAEGLLAGFALARLPATSERCRSVAAVYDWRTRVAPQLVATYRGHG